MTDLAQTSDAPPQPERIGRYARSELAAMAGKRGRKPPEYYELFPEQRREPALPKAEKPRSSKKAKAAAAVAVPVDDDALAAQVRAASPAVRKLISDLLAVVGQLVEASPAAAVIQAVTISEPVYADPESEADVEQVDPALAG